MKSPNFKFGEMLKSISVLTGARLGEILRLGSRPPVDSAPGSKPVSPTVSNINLETDRQDLSSQIGILLRDRPELADAEYILYADVNFNFVDGSSVWLSSMVSALAASGKVLVIAKQAITTDIVWSNIVNRQNVILLSPRDFNAAQQAMSATAGVAIIKQLDALLPKVRRVVVRGLAVADLLTEDRQFRERSCVYLTDFYSLQNGQLSIGADAAKAVLKISLQALCLLTQTEALRQKISEISRHKIASHPLPPPIPDNLPSITVRPRSNSAVKIGYAGKIAPQWGIEELLDWTAGLAKGGIKTELHIVANKVSDGGFQANIPGFGQAMLRKIEEAGGAHYSDLNRQSSIDLMAQMDFVWCFRPPSLEDNTLEVSTKLIEMVASGAACLCYPNKINQELLLEDYPYFVRKQDDLAQIIKRRVQPLPSELVARVRREHSISQIARELKNNVLGDSEPDRSRNGILFAGHDFKFIDPYISHLKAKGYSVVRDQWDWGGPANLASSQQLQCRADTVFCEWGLANAVWYSRHKREGSRLFVRVHLQEINERAQKFGFQIDKQAVDRFIFIEEGVRQIAIQMFDIPPQKTEVIPNFILDDEYRFAAETKHKEDCVRLGMIGITPQRKRFDLAVDLLEKLLDQGQCATLAIKGPRPEELPFMHGPSRIRELDYYNAIYNRIDADPKLVQAITFEPWGNDVAIFYRDIDFILSSSDFESFHYALADGILAGCHPLIWPWKGADAIYHPDWISQDTRAALERIQAVRTMGQPERIEQARHKRDLLVDRYGYAKLFDRLSRTLRLESD